MTRISSKIHSQSNGGYQRLQDEDLGNDSKKTNVKNSALKPSFLRALFHSVGYQFALAGIVKLLYDQSNFLQPKILKYDLQAMNVMGITLDTASS